MVKAGKSYIDGTAARKIEYDVYEENKVLKAKKNAKVNDKAKMKLVFGILVIFSMLFVIIFRYALITEMNYNVNKTMKKFNEIKNENVRLKVDIEKQTDLNHIKEVAEKKLGMQKPDRYQVVYVKVPKNDFTKVAANYKITNMKAANDSIFFALKDKVSKFTHLLY